MKTLSRRSFIKAGALFVPTLILPRKSLGQFASFYDKAFIANSGMSLNPNVSNWVSRVQANGGASPSNATITAVNTWWTGIVSAGLDTKILAANFFAPDSLIACSTPFKVGGGHDPWQGTVDAGALSINGVSFFGSKIFKTGLVPSVVYPSVNNNGVVLYVFTSANTGTENTLGCADAGFSNVLYMLDVQSGTLFFQSCSTTISVANAGFNGWLSGQRTAANAVALYGASSVFPHAALVSSAAAPAAGLTSTTDIWVGGLNIAGVLNQPSADLGSFFACTTGLSSSDDTTLFNLTQTLRVTLGGGFR